MAMDITYDTPTVATTDVHSSVSSSSSTINSYIDAKTGKHMPTILCCLSGIHIPPNPANMCINCLKSQVDITEGISKQLILLYCRNCNRYQRPPFVNVELESKEMLAL